jgi:hypothetical protein
MLALMSILFFAIPILLNLINLKYLYDIKNKSNCEEINSPYINIFFNYYLVELCLLILLIIILSYIFHNYSKIKNNLKRSRSRLFLIGDFFKKNQKIFELFILLISGILIKLYYDIGKEEKCKGVDKYIRLYLFYGQIISFCVISYNIIVN